MKGSEQTGRSHFDTAHYFYVMSPDPSVPSGWFMETPERIAGPYATREDAIAGESRATA